MALTEKQFDAWWKENGIESATFAEKSAARKGWNAAIAARAAPASEQKPKQPWPNHNWRLGCSPENCSGCGTEPIERRAPQPDYKAQRDALLKSLDDIAWNRRPGDRRSPSALLEDAERMALAAISSVKGGA